MCRYGVPECLHSDQGANFGSEVIQAICSLLSINRTRTSAYHPMGNGQVERFNTTVEAMLSKIVKENQRDWDSQLPKALFAYRTSIHESTWFTTPYHLNFGRTPTLPIDVMLGRFGKSGWILPTVCQGYSQSVAIDTSASKETLIHSSQWHIQDFTKGGGLTICAQSARKNFSDHAHHFRPLLGVHY